MPEVTVVVFSLPGALVLAGVTGWFYSARTRRNQDVQLIEA